MLFGVGVSAVRGDKVTNPAERAARSNPESRRQDQPNNSREDAAVVNLADARNHQT